MLKDAKDINVSSQKFVEEFNDFCTKNELAEKVKADHICIKCSSKEVFEKQRAEFEFESSFLYQSIFPGRRIAIIGLNDFIPTVVGDIKYLELSDQKKDGSQDDRIDHIEIIPISMSYDELVKYLKDKGIEVKEIVRPHHTTHDVYLQSGFIVRLSRELLIDTIKREEMI